MTFYAKYRTDDHELVWTQDTPITDVEDDMSVKEFDGDLGFRVWNSDALTFEDYVYVAPDLPTPPNPFELQAQIDDLTAAWLEG